MKNARSREKEKTDETIGPGEACHGMIPAKALYEAKVLDMMK